MDKIKGTPWAPIDGVVEAPVSIAIPPEKPQGELPPSVEVDPQVRRMKIPKSHRPMKMKRTGERKTERRGSYIVR